MEKALRSALDRGTSVDLLQNVGGAVDTETAGRCYSLLLASAFRRPLGLPCSPFCLACKWALTQG